MKLAGRKNDGAWFRFNRYLKELRALGGESGELTAWENKMNNLAELVAYHAALVDMLTKTGVAQPGELGTPASLVTQWVAHGIPRQVWMGKLSFTTYTKTEGSGGAPDTWAADFQGVAHRFGKQVRKAAKEFQAATREINDLANLRTLQTGNPGGLPDAEED